MMQVYVKRHPRSLALATEDHILVFRPVQRSMKCIVELARRDTVDFSAYVPLSREPCLGFLGLMNVGQDIFLCVITRSRLVASPRPGDTVHRIYNVEFHCLTRPDWDFVTLDTNGYPIDAVTGKVEYVEHPCAAIRKLLSNGSFYYSTDFDLTCVIQNRYVFSLSWGPQTPRPP